MSKFSAREMILVSLFAALTAVGAWISVPLPFTPVPVTLQVLFVLLAGALLGSFLGAFSQIIYVLLGTIGLPVFAQFRSGPAVLFGPTGGYLIGFIVAAFLVGLIIEKLPFSPIASTTIAIIAGVVTIYILGVLWFAYQQNLSLTAAFIGGMLPFVVADILKGIIAAIVILAVRPRLQLFQTSS